LNDGQQPLTPLGRQQLVLGTERRINLLLCNCPIGGRLGVGFLVRIELLQGEIMRDAEDPAKKVFSRSPQLEMPEEGQEHFLDNFLRIDHGNVKRKRITEKRASKLFEELHNLALDL
jgi:hypothetical protein